MEMKLECYKNERNEEMVSLSTWSECIRKRKRQREKKWKIVTGFISCFQYLHKVPFFYLHLFFSSHFFLFSQLSSFMSSRPLLPAQKNSSTFYFIVETFFCNCLTAFLHFTPTPLIVPFLSIPSALVC
jgi:hypothetical protein